MDQQFDRFFKELLEIERDRALTSPQKRARLVDWLNRLETQETNVELAIARTLASHIEIHSKDGLSDELGEALCMQAYFGFVSADSFITSVCIVLDACLQSGNDAIARQIGCVVSQALRKFSPAFGLNEALRDQLLQAIDRRLTRLSPPKCDGATSAGHDQ